MVVGLIDIIYIIALFQLFIFIFFLCLKRPRSNSNILLAVFLFSQIMVIINYESGRYYKDILNYSPHFFYVGAPFFFVAAPSFYLYVKSLAYSDFKLTKRQLIHLVPFLIVVSIFTIVFYVHSAEEKRLILEKYNFSRGFIWYYTLIFLVYILVYNISALFILVDYRKKIKQEYSSVEKINLSWLNYVLLGFLFACSTSIVSFLTISFEIDIVENVRLVNCLAFFIFFNYIFFKALVQPDLFKGIKEITAQKRPFLSKAVEQKYLKKLIDFMKDKKPFLEPEITLFELSRQVSIPHRALSEIINNSLNQNFYEFINGYRIKESKFLLGKKENRHKTVLEILYEVGYNSKSSFNVSFKKNTGMTPSQFKKLHNN